MSHVLHRIRAFGMIGGPQLLLGGKCRTAERVSPRSRARLPQPFSGGGHNIFSTSGMAFSPRLRDSTLRRISGKCLTVDYEQGGHARPLQNCSEFCRLKSRLWVKTQRFAPRPTLALIVQRALVHSALASGHHGYRVLCESRVLLQPAPPIRDDQGHVHARAPCFEP